MELQVRNSMKGSVAFDLLVDHPIDQEEESYAFLDKDILLGVDKTWQMYFNDFSNHKSYRVDIL